jgi:hypothetical protein
MSAPTDDNSTIKSTRSNAWQKLPPLSISYVSTEAAFPPLSPTKNHMPATPSTTSETLDEETIQSAISVALKKLEDKHRQELDQLKLDMQQKIAKVEMQMKELGQQVAVQTYQALVKEESPLATKTELTQLKQEVTMVSTQLSTLISMLQHGTIITPIQASSPPRNQKRTKLNLTPEKSFLDDILTQEKSVSSATSNLEEEMEGCED